MTAWVVWQDTDFCRELWEERLYNAVGMFLLHKISILISGSQHFVKITLFDDVWLENTLKSTYLKKLMYK